MGSYRGNEIFGGNFGEILWELIEGKKFLGGIFSLTFLALKWQNHKGESEN